MKTIISIPFLCILVFYFSLVSCLPAKLPPSISIKKDQFKQKQWKLAVIDFAYEDQGEGKEGANYYKSAGKDGGKVIANMFSAELNKMEGIQVLERSGIEQVMKEQELQLTGAIDESTAVNLGKMVGADAVILGDVTDYLSWTNTGVTGSTISFSSRMIDIESGQVLLNTTITRIRMGIIPSQNVQLTVQEVYESILKELK